MKVFKIDAYQKSIEKLQAITQSVFDNSICEPNITQYSREDFDEWVNECFNRIEELESSGSIKIESLEAEGFNLLKSAKTKLSEICAYKPYKSSFFEPYDDINKPSLKIYELFLRTEAIINYILDKPKESSFDKLKKNARSAAKNIFDEDNLIRYLYLVEKYLPSKQTKLKFKHLYHWFSINSHFINHDKKIYADFVDKQYDIKILGGNKTFTNKCAIKTQEQCVIIDDLIKDY